MTAQLHGLVDYKVEQESNLGELAAKAEELIEQNQQLKDELLVTKNNLEVATEQRSQLKNGKRITN